ncbi:MULTISPECIES: DNA modification methylase [unclassified Microbacterium]|uniref:DNA modification methylase n=1 Tax=unclassified Microbacterium TaxID=2609290 RepID=UPI001604A995|nr:MULTISPECIES: DNA modification methylase [unclassified Microbacterium]QNA93287.1 DNA modification methylase [Microbacterium sp. Se63.02b]QYM63497.1 DNA modification methylase [Microbacterium sp. Se5.02b]
MKSRLVASAALSAIVLLGATGCTFITPQSTKTEYAASDGVNISDADGPIDVRNALIIANDDGTIGNFIAGIVNPTEESATLTIALAGSEPFSITVPGGGTVSLGADEEPLRILDLDTKPGATVEMHFQSGDSTGVKAEVPVLDGSLPYYSDLVPSESVRTSTPTPTPTDTAAPAPAE